MKKLLSIILLFALLMCLIACDEDNTPNNPTTPPQQQTPPSETTVFETLTSLAGKQYTKVYLDVATVTGDVTLQANYVITASEVTYAVEQLNQLPTDGNFAGLLPDYKTIFSGTATVENGKVTKFDGAPVSLPDYDQLTGSFLFKESNLKNVKTESGKLTADVTSASEFFGKEVTATDVKVEVLYSDTALQKVTVTYKTANAAVTTVHTFEK